MPSRYRPLISKVELAPHTCLKPHRQASARHNHKGVVMELSKLADHVKRSEIDAVHLVTMEGGSYVMHAIKSGKSHPLINAKGATLHVASLEEARKNLKGVPEVPLFLVHPAVYEEMVGLASTDRQLNPEPIPWHSSL